MFQEMMVNSGGGGGGKVKEGTFTATGSANDNTISDVGFEAKKILCYTYSITGDTLNNNSLSWYYDADISTQHTIRLGKNSSGSPLANTIKNDASSSGCFKQITSSGFTINCGSYTGTVKYFAIG